MALIEFDDVSHAKILVIGVGGGGGNAVNTMISGNLDGVEFVVANTDMQALEANMAPHKIQLGNALTKGLGAGANPDIGRRSAEESLQHIADVISGADMVFVTAGMGGGTGTGSAPIVASVAKELGILTVAVVTKPFAFEGKRRMLQSEQALTELIDCVDTVIVIPNERLMETVERGTSFFDAFRIADDILRQAVQGISDIITIPGIINRDFSDIRNIMLGMGYAMMGTADASGEGAALAAAEKAISCPLLEAGGVRGARGVLINISASSRLSLHDVNEACSLIRAATAYEDVQINFGVVMNEAMEDEVKITVIATGFQRDHLPQITRSSTFASVSAPMPEPVQAPPTLSFLSEREPAAEPEPVAEIEAEEAEIAAPEPEPEPAMPMNDIDVPAYLRRERRLYQ
ncbi:MAG: cell division protein FtsZ [Terriglobia bacterium]